MPLVTFTLTEPTDSASHLLFGVPVDTPEQTVEGLSVTRGTCRGLLRARNSGQQAVLIEPEQGHAEVTVSFSPAPSRFPHWLFAPTGGAHETPSGDLLALMLDVVAQAPTPAARVEAVVRHVDARFEYGVREVGLADDTAAMPALACDTHLGTCVDTHSYAVAAMRAAGIDAAYISGLYFPDDTDVSQPGHCWFVVDAAGAPHHWDISHHLKYGLGPTTPAYNPKPGTRFALTAGRDLVFAVAGRPVSVSILKGFVDASGPDGHSLPTGARLS
ncbi:transglutaminase-like domain-containing protein [Pannonibacter tanglangensis]|uniref:Transglutaminase-like domain-containing protein n=1 Tax=Pannonibacter tanglangensis TaxID=2750084 RepID=A0ABW9ZQY3_9HYPH|nr:transglutaminase-like domain-containing protein [Pannonibacter sp. XCT-34]NBN65130.1 hypothetical protein [Pannonibacter sp. XCT-34]